MIARTSVDRIKAATAHAFDVPVREMVSHHGRRGVALPRQVAMAIAYRMTPHSNALIGRLFGGRDHTTVIHARQKIAKLQTEDRDIDRIIRTIEARLRPPEPVREVQLEFLIGPLFDQAGPPFTSPGRNYRPPSVVKQPAPAELTCG